MVISGSCARRLLAYAETGDTFEKINRIPVLGTLDDKGCIHSMVTKGDFLAICPSAAALSVQLLTLMHRNLYLLRLERCYSLELSSPRSERRIPEELIQRPSKFRQPMVSGAEDAESIRWVVGQPTCLAVMPSTTEHQRIRLREPL